MAQAVVDQPEIIQPEHDDADQLVGAACVPDSLAQTIIQQIAIGHICQFVVRGQVFKLFLLDQILRGK